MAQGNVLNFFEKNKKIKYRIIELIPILNLSYTSIYRNLCRLIEQGYIIRIKKGTKVYFQYNNDNNDNNDNN